jgi:hypothetical protein
VGHSNEGVGVRAAPTLNPRAEGHNQAENEGPPSDIGRHDTARDWHFVPIKILCLISSKHSGCSSLSLCLQHSSKDKRIVLACSKGCTSTMLALKVRYCNDIAFVSNC